MNTLSLLNRMRAKQGYKVQQPEPGPIVLRPLVWLLSTQEVAKYFSDNRTATEVGRLVAKLYRQERGHSPQRGQRTIKIGDGEPHHHKVSLYAIADLTLIRRAIAFLEVVQSQNIDSQNNWKPD